VCLSTIDWNFLWQGHQEIMSRLAMSGSHVVFVENMGGVRTIGLRDVGRIGRRLRAVIGGAVRPRPAAFPRLRIVAPVLLPFPKARVARIVNHVLIRRLARSIRRLSGPDPIIFSFLPSGEARELIARVGGPGSVVVYYCVADFVALAEDQSALVASETQLVRSADLVFVNSSRFAERFSALNPRVFYFPGGVSLDHFDPRTAGDIPPELARLPSPRIGYVGGLHQHLDRDLLRKLAREMPNASIVVVGPVLTEIGALQDEPNIHLLGPRAWTDLPPLLRAFDVGLIPYVRSAYTETVYPTKLFEYLAMGCPVVSADLPEVLRLDLPEFAVRTARDHSGFIAAVRDALAETDPSAADRRRELASHRDWAAIVDRMAALISEEVTAKGAAPSSDVQRTRGSVRDVSQ
jgi:glycosyltransferase involved in cell wall biosynthesis